MIRPIRPQVHHTNQMTSTHLIIRKATRTRLATQTLISIQAIASHLVIALLLPTEIQPVIRTTASLVIMALMVTGFPITIKIIIRTRLTMQTHTTIKIHAAARTQAVVRIQEIMRTQAVMTRPTHARSRSTTLDRTSEEEIRTIAPRAPACREMRTI